jgi:putative transposase
LVALSTGEKVGNPKCFNAKRRKLKKAQKALSRKQKASNNRYKACLKVAKVHLKIIDARKDFLHKLTTRLVRENQAIAALGFSCEEYDKQPKTCTFDRRC